MIGRSIAHYEILEKIGAGSMGIVYRAKDTRLGRDVALKMLPPAAAADPGRRTRFEQEARAVAALSHPNIVTIFSVEEADGHHFITMELVSGRLLSAVAAGGALDPNAFLDIASQLANAIVAAHGCGIIHRDLKPQNVMLTADEQVKVLDFGLARLWGQEEGEAKTLALGQTQTAEGALLGTLAYMSPEQAQAKPADARSDLFSLGVVFYELLTGRHPFRTDSGVETAAAILRDDPPPATEVIPSLPAELGRILRRCLVKDPARRYQTAIDLRNDLEELRDELGQSSAGETAASEPKPGDGSFASRGGDSSPSGVSLPGDRPGIAVVTFVDHTGSPEHAWLATGLPSMLLTGLAQTPGLDVVSPERIYEIAKSLGHDGKEAVSPGLVTEIGRRSGASAVATGNVFRAGERYRIDVRLADVATGRLLAGETVSGEDVFGLVDTLTAKITGILNIDADSNAPGVATVSTPSIGAYREYDQGMNAYRDYRFPEARDHLLRAVEIDPRFARAHLALMQVYRSLGERIRMDHHREAVLEHQDRLPERDRLLFLALQERDRDPDRAVALFEDLIARYPDSEYGYVLLAMTHVHNTLDRDSWIAAVQRGVRALPNSAERRNIHAYSITYHGSYEEAVGELEEYQRLSPGNQNPMDSLAEITLSFGRVEESLELYEQLSDSDAASSASLFGLSYCRAALGRYPAAFDAMRACVMLQESQGIVSATPMFMSAFYLARVGRYREAIREIERGLARIDEMGARRIEIALELLTAWIGLERGRPADVFQAAGRARKLVSQLRSEVDIRITNEHALHLMGVAEARAGHPESAAEIAAEQRSLGPEPQLEWEHLCHWLDGEIALSRGDLNRAAECFQKPPARKALFGLNTPDFSIFVSNSILRDWTARMAAHCGDLAGALHLYQQLTTPVEGWQYTAVLEPRYLLEMARLSCRMGDDARGHEYAGRFLDLWSEADPGSPELDEAKAISG